MYKIGDKVKWRGDDSAQGVVVHEPMPLWRGMSDPIDHILWNDGQRTMLNDDGAMTMVYSESGQA